MRQREEAQKALEPLPVAVDLGAVGSLGLRERPPLPEQRGERSGGGREHRVGILSRAASHLEAAVRDLRAEGVLIETKLAPEPIKHNRGVDLSLERIEAAAADIDPIFLNTPQFVDERLSTALGREVLVKVETLNPIGSFKGRGTWLLSRELDPACTWVCATAGNFGQGLAYAARARGARVHIFASADAPPEKLERMRGLGAQVEVREASGSAAREYAAESDERILVVDGLDPAIAEGAATIGVEVESADPVDSVVVQIGDGALISGVARWLKSKRPETRVIGVCASGAPAMARSFAAGRPVSTRSTDTIAAALSITEPVPESLARVLALVDEVVMVDDDHLRDAIGLIAETLGLLVEPAGAAGVAALSRYRAKLPGERVAVVLTGAGTPVAT